MRGVLIATVISAFALSGCAHWAEWAPARTLRESSAPARPDAAPIASVTPAQAPRAPARSDLAPPTAAASIVDAQPGSTVPARLAPERSALLQTAAAASIADVQPRTTVPAVAAAAPAASATLPWSSLFAPDDKLADCKVVVGASGAPQTIEASATTTTRLEFPGRISSYEMATPRLWNAFAQGDSVLIRPKRSAQTGMSVSLANGQRYEFLVRAKAGAGPSCVLVTDSAPSTEDGDVVLPLQSLTRVLAQQQHHYERQIAEMRRQIEQQALDQIKEFQYSIYTRYSWAASGGREDDRNLVTAVYDDGRFTYVRIATSAFGLPSVGATLDDRDVPLQYSYDDLTGVFTINGLYDHLRVRLGEHRIEIGRQG